MIERAIDNLFDRVKGRYLGPQAAKLVDKRIVIGYKPELTLQGLYGAAAAEERTRPDAGIQDSLVRTAEGYLDASRAKTKARIVTAVEHFLREAEYNGIDTDVETVLGGQLADLFGQTTQDLHRILDTEATHARNMGTLEGIVKVSAAANIQDPVVYFIIVRDGDACAECVRLHTLQDKPLTPRVWLLSEVGHGYHTRGDSNPKIGGLHPFCRCTMATLMPGYGFVGAALRYLGKDHSELKKQRG